MSKTYFSKDAGMRFPYSFEINLSDVGEEALKKFWAEKGGDAWQANNGDVYVAGFLLTLKEAHEARDGTWMNALHKCARNISIRISKEPIEITIIFA